MDIISFEKIKDKFFPSQKVCLFFIDVDHQFLISAVVHSYKENLLSVLTKDEKILVPSLLKKQLLLMCSIKNEIYGSPFFYDQLIRDNCFVKIVLKAGQLNNSDLIGKKFIPVLSKQKQYLICLFESFEKNVFQSDHFLDIVSLNSINNLGICIESNQNIFIGNHLYILNHLSDRYDFDHFCVVMWKVKNLSTSSYFQYTYGLRFLNEKSHVLKDIEEVSRDKIL